MVQIAPSILTADFGNMQEQLMSARRGGANYVHFDLMDNDFVPNLTFGSLVVRSLREPLEGMTFDCHLMVSDPDSMAAALATAGADHVVVHLEAVKHLHRSLQVIKGHGMKAGIALNPGTALGAIDRNLADLIDVIMIMTVNPGFGGQKFIEPMMSKIEAARNLIDEHFNGALLEVDGGVNESNIRQVVDLGVDVVVAGSAIFNERAGPEQNIRRMLEAAEG